MVSTMNKIILVLGGNGFIGRAVVEHLRRNGHEVIVGTRADKRSLKPGERKVALHKTTAADWDTLIAGCDVVINAVGILRQRWQESYEQVHFLAVQELANACARQNTKFMHVSALGLYAPVKSRFLLSKRKGELAIQRSKANWTIIRPSLLEGGEGYGARWFRKLAKLPIHCTPANAIGRIAPLHVNVLGNKIAELVDKDTSGKIYEFGGDRIFKYKEYLCHLAANKPLLHISIPAWLVRAITHVLDIFHLTPLSFGHYELMLRDNLPQIPASHKITHPSGALLNVGTA